MNCAVCRRPIASGEILVSTEGAFHPRCHDVFARFRRSIARANERLEEMKRAELTSRRESADLRVANMTLETQVQQLRTQLRAAEASAKAKEELLEQERIRHRTNRQERDQAVRRHAELLAENDQLRNELKLHQALGPTQAKTEEIPPAEDGMSDIEKRFSLLELD